MQTTDTADKRYGSASVLPGQAQAQATVAETKRSDAIFTADGLVLNNVTDTGAIPDLPPVAVLEQPVVRRTKPEQPHLHRTQSPQTPQETGCTAKAEAIPGPSGDVVLSIDAPCHGEKHVTVRHDALIFTPRLDDAGQTRLTVPALSGTARFDISVDANTHVVVKTQVDDIDEFSRVVLQWRDAAGFELHVRTFGALYGGRGHLWHGATPARVTAAAAQSGQLIHLGDASADGTQATEIYTFPVNHSVNSDQIELTIEVEVTAENCGRTIAAQALEIAGAQTVRSQNVTFAVPGCDAIGDFLVLNNAFEDLKLAAR